jgi:hypothetical protein
MAQFAEALRASGKDPTRLNITELVAAVDAILVSVRKNHR